MLLRAARPEDAMAVALVHVRAWQEAYRGLLPDDYLDGLEAEDRAARYTFGATDPAGPRTTVAVEEGAILGFATIAPTRDADAGGSGELCALYVDPAWWDRGVGRGLMAQARQDLAGIGFTEALLWVLVGNERAQRFYRRDGWEPDGSRRFDQIWGATVDEVRFRSRL